MLRVCYVCGIHNVSNQKISPFLFRCNSSICYLKVIQGIDRLFIDLSLIPNQKLTEEWKNTITKEKIPFIGVDIKQKGSFLKIDPFVPIPLEAKKVNYYTNRPVVQEYGSVAHLIQLLKMDKYTEEELVKQTKLAVSTVKNHVNNILKKKYEMKITIEEGKKYYRIISEEYT